MHLSSRDDLTGTVDVGSLYTFKVFGPFGVGYNIKVKSKRNSGVMRYLRDGTCQGVTGRPFRKKRYEFSDTGFYRLGGEALSLGPNNEFEPVDDEAAMALFVVNHHYSNRTGPFAPQA